MVESKEQEKLNKELLNAVQVVNIEMVKAAIVRGASVNCRDKDKDLWDMIPLHSAAARTEAEDILKVLLSAGADVNAKDRHNQTPLHLAAENATSVDVLKVLLSAGADVNALNLIYWTPLHFAAYFNTNISVSDLLIQAGADLYKRTFTGGTPLDYAKTNHNNEVAALIQAYMDGTKQVHGLAVFQDPSVELKHILATDSCYKSYDMRIMVVGRYGVGKSTLVMLLVGDDIPKGRFPTEGISLLEGRCGLEIENGEWVQIDKDDYNAKDIVYDRMLMAPTQTEPNVDLQQKEIQVELPRLNVDRTSVQPQQEDLPTSSSNSSEIGEACLPSSFAKSIKNAEINARPKITNVAKSKIKTKLSKSQFKKRLELALKNGTYKMKVGRLIFWDFGGQYVYYTTHQTFISYRALFIVVFDGTKDLDEVDDDEECIAGQHGKPTAAIFLQHWVNSILTYCKGITGDIPKILFVGTHKDKIKENVDSRRAMIFEAIEQLFKEHEGRNHLALENRIFINATDNTDPDLDNLKKVIADLTFRHPCWGEPMPNSWVPLELEIAELVAEGTQIISREELGELNRHSEVSVLSEKDLHDFLIIQHSLGKLVYFNTQELRNFVIISPLFMVETMKSFITDAHFWPEDQKGKKTFNRMATKGLINKHDLFTLWDSNQFCKIKPYKEFVLYMLLHLDIISEQRRYDITSGIRLSVEDYFVPCMVVRTNTTKYLDKECIPRRAIGIAFAFKGKVVPTAIPNRLIASCLNIWALKSYEETQMIFSGLVVLTYDKAHDLVIRVDSSMILLYIVHKSSRGLIVSDVATKVRQCLNMSLENISDFYRRSVTDQSTRQNMPFQVQHGCPELKCYMQDTAVRDKQDVICSGHQQKYESEVWYQDKDAETCNPDCKGLSEDALSKTPSDPELFRLSALKTETLQELIIKLDVKKKEWDNMERNHQGNIEIVKFLMLIKWRNNHSGTFKKISDALMRMNMPHHILCQVRRKQQMVGDGIQEEHTGIIPTDEILDALAPTVGKESFQLGIVLGLPVYELENIQLKFNDNIAQTREILQRWRDDRNVKATFGVLQQALVDAGIGTMYLTEKMEEIGVKKHKFKETRLHKDGEITTGAGESLKSEKNNISIPVHIEPTFVVSLKEAETLLQVSKSVGYIVGNIESGTCWRVGVDKIITAFHVVRNNIWNSMDKIMDETKLSAFKVVFDYIDYKSHPSNSNNVFEVEPKVIYFNESLDVAVLQLKKDKKNQFPSALKTFYSLDPKYDTDKKIFLISHNEGQKKKFNGDIGLWKPSEKRISDLENFCEENGWDNGYTELNKKGRLILKCKFEHGASGSPGIIIQDDTPYIVLLYIRGFPDFYYSQQFSSENKRNFPSDKLLQQGVDIGAILDDLKSKPIHQNLREEILSEEAKNEKEQNQHLYAMGIPEEHTGKIPTDESEKTNISMTGISDDLELAPEPETKSVKPKHQKSKRREKKCAIL